MNIRVIVALLFLLCFHTASMGFPGAEQPSKPVASKYVKKRAKELKNEGWVVYGQDQSLQDALTTLCQQQDESADALQVTGFGTGATEQLAVRKATMSATRQVASMQHTQAESSQQTRVSSNGSSERVDIENTNTAETRHRMRPLKPALTLVRKTANGIEAQVFCIVNPSK